MGTKIQENKEKNVQTANRQKKKSVEKIKDPQTL